MKKICFLSTLVLTVLLGKLSVAQDFSNKGKDFYVCFPAHVQSSNLATLSIWITSDKASSGAVTMGNGAFSQTFSIAANGLAEIKVPHSAAHISNGESNMVIRKSIRVKVDDGRPAVVAYAQQWAGARSAATLLLPVNVLGRKYHSVNFTQNSGGRSQFDIIAVKDNTVVEITPMVNGAARSKITVNMPLAGDVYQYQLTGADINGDLTGTYIESVASASGGCLPIAVFSGSSNVSMGTNRCGAYSSADPLFQQLYPINTWGKNFGFIPFANYPEGNPYRVMASEDNTNVFFDGALVATLNKGQIYPSTFTSQPVTLGAPTRITADKPITVAQYAQSNGCSGAGTNQGDPDMVILNPIEQNISDITIFSTRQEVINSQWINVLLPTNAIPSFKLSRNGGPFVAPTAAWQPFGSLPGYSYLVEQLQVPAGISDSYRLRSDSGFNIIAYGWGTNESYAYSAGTNVKDIYQFMSTMNPQATVNFPATCIGAPFQFSMTFPYEPTRIQWIFGTALNAMGFADQDLASPAYTSTSIVNGRTIYTYSLPATYSISTAGTYPIKIIAENPTPDGCGGIQEIDFDMEVYNPPTADFTFTHNGCLSSPVQFNTVNNGNGRTVTGWQWDFGDAATATTANPTHSYTTAGSYTVKHAAITDIGCISTEASHVVTVTDPPVANFAVTGPYCVGKPISFDDQSTIIAPATISKWTWNFGDGSPVVTVNAPASADQTHAYSAPGTYNVTLEVETASGCKSIVFTSQVIIKANPVANFNLPVACLPAGAAQFNDMSTISGGTINQWDWDFGDATTANTPSPLHNYTTSGPFNVSLTVTTTDGCVNTKTQALTTVYAEPQAAFNFPAEVCLGNPASFTDNSTAANSTITGWTWDFGDGSPLSNAPNPTHTYTAAGTYTVKLNVTNAAGCQTVTKFATHNVVVNPLPTIGFTNSTPVCENSNVLFTSTSTPNAGTFTTYSWTVNTASQGGNTPTLNYTPTSAGVYTIGLTATTDKGCFKTGTSSLTVNPKPAADFALPTVCLPAGTANFSSSSTISSGSIASYAWDFGDGNTATTPTATNNYTTTGPFTVSLLVTSDNGCKDTKTQILSTVYAEPQAAFTNPAEICLGNSVTFTDQSSAAASTVTSWTWDFGDGSPTSNAQNPSHTYATAGTYTVTLNVGSAAGCQTVTKFATHNITVNPLPQANFNTITPGCVGKVVSFSDVSVANAGSIVKWTWNFGDGNSATNPVGGTVNNTYANTGNYNVTLQVETDKGCISTVTTKPVDINVLPNAEFLTPDACTSDLAAAFTDQSTVTSGSVASWAWDFGDANANPGNPNTSNAQNATHHFTVAGSYTITLVATSDKGCTDDQTHSIFVNSGNITADFTVANPTTLCSNKQVSLTDASAIDIGKLIRQEIYWDYTNDPTIKTTTANPAIGATYTHTYPEFFTPASKTVTIRYVVYSGTTCLSFVDRQLTLLATPQLQFTAVPEVCEDAAAFQVTQARLMNTLPGAGVFTGAGITSGGNFTPSAAGVGNHPITYTYTGTNGCINSVTNTIAVNPKPALNAGPDKFILEGGSVVLTPALNANIPVTYTWTPSTGLSSATAANPIASPANDITYTVLVTSDKGCTATDDVFVKVLKKPLIPNIFSPNGDGVHDRWVVPYLESYPGCTIDIYNRYGQLVYHSIGYATPWDGKANGKDVPVGTYYYVIDPKNGREKLAGYVDVIR